MCGFDDFLIKMALDTDFIKKFFNIILAYQEKVIDIYYSEIGEYIHYTSSGDDFAIQENSFVSPETFDALIKPYFEEEYAIQESIQSVSFTPAEMCTA